jgi:hypothetical protein
VFDIPVFMIFLYGAEEAFVEARIVHIGSISSRLSNKRRGSMICLALKAEELVYALNFLCSEVSTGEVKPALTPIAL